MRLIIQNAKINKIIKKSNEQLTDVSHSILPTTQKSVTDNRSSFFPKHKTEDSPVPQTQPEIEKSKQARDNRFCVLL